MSPTFEIPVFSAAAAKVAVDNAATRLEVNRTGSYAAGGLTPTRAEVDSVLSALGGPQSTTPLRVMIRPRGPPPSGEPDFLYSDEEFREMRSDLEAFVESGLLQATRGDGFVFGILARDGDDSSSLLRIDTDRNRQLVQAAEPYACVFHRAFDSVLGKDLTSAEEGLAALRDCGFAGVLTAGGPGSRGAIEHADSLKKLVSAERAVAGSAQARPHASIELVVGGGVRSSNVGELAKAILAAEEGGHTSVVSFHSSCLEDSAAATAKGAEGETISAEEVERIHKALASIEGM
ncbi:hypothetical protein Sste5346_000412 [Sporothrix stenoceras]|uniref:Copper homeostasis protein cutC homolog n=1 Tax=Sporothrix stenoceras TaxID=5173 RepID=A0ABR3ZR09_9PEZI